jgi:hypothetical protein
VILTVLNFSEVFPINSLSLRLAYDMICAVNWDGCLCTPNRAYVLHYLSSPALAAGRTHGRSGGFMRRIVLIQPKRDGRVFGKSPGSPYTLMRLASLVPAEIPVEIWDENVRDLPMDTLREGDRDD